MPQPRLAEPAIALKNILFATDFSRPSREALTYALPIARKFGSKIYVVHVVPEEVGLPTSAREGLHAFGIRHKSDDRNALANLGAELAGIPHEILSPKGDVPGELSKIVETNDIDLIVIGTHGRSGVGKLLMGSVAEKIFRRASCPVLTVGPAVSAERESIVDLHAMLFATDFSAASTAALPYAVSLALANSARLYVLRVTAEPAAEVDEKALKDSLRKLVPEKALFTSQPKMIVEYGPPAERILGVAEELAIDLIVLGVKRTPVRFEPSAHLPLATAYKVVRQAISPVLTVRG